MNQVEIVKENIIDRKVNKKKILAINFLLLSAGVASVAIIPIGTLDILIIVLAIIFIIGFCIWRL